MLPGSLRGLEGDHGRREARDGRRLTCDTSGLAAILKFGETHRINNTPTVVLASGKRLVGATPPEIFLQELEQGGRPAK